jgi:hypothetical protein
VDLSGADKAKKIEKVEVMAVRELNSDQKK